LIPLWAASCRKQSFDTTRRFLSLHSLPDNPRACPFRFIQFPRPSVLSPEVDLLSSLPPMSSSLTSKRRAFFPTRLFLFLELNLGPEALSSAQVLFDYPRRANFTLVFSRTEGSRPPSSHPLQSFSVVLFPKFSVSFRQRFPTSCFLLMTSDSGRDLSFVKSSKPPSKLSPQIWERPIFC